MNHILRFAPSPTGLVHIGNIRTAIFNWLQARHLKSEFLLRVEDTDKERSTTEAIDALLECMRWLGLDHDGGIYYQSQHEAEHVAAAERLLAEGKAYRKTAEGEGAKGPIVFRIPWDCSAIPEVRSVGPVELELCLDVPVEIGPEGVKFATVSKKGKPDPRDASLAGFRDLRLHGADGALVFELEKEVDAILGAGKSFVFERCAKMTFTRREVFYADKIKGELAKPLDGIKDLVIVRSDGSPVFHLANIYDDAMQHVTLIMRGDDHVENTYRHILLFRSLGYTPPDYAHMPMIVNMAGKPYSKRDGDAFVGDFRAKGYLPQALFNYLALLGWSPGDDREKMTVAEMVEAFTMERVKSSPAQFDAVKLLNLNGLYMAELDDQAYLSMAWEALGELDWGVSLDKDYFLKVAALMRSRLKLCTEVAGWKYFFRDDYEIDEKAVAKFVQAAPAPEAIAALLPLLEGMGEFTLENIEKAVRAAEAAAGMGEGKLNQPLRVALTGGRTGAGIYETIEVLGLPKTIERLREYSGAQR